GADAFGEKNHRGAENDLIGKRVENGEEKNIFESGGKWSRVLQDGEKLASRCHLRSPKKIPCSESGQKSRAVCKKYSSLKSKLPRLTAALD
ncbi:MAG: hypothetical protein ABJC04_02060, partial [Verrucomicrobiota bacterium]